MGMLHMQSRV